MTQGIAHIASSRSSHVGTLSIGTRKLVWDNFKLFSSLLHCNALHVCSFMGEYCHIFRVAISSSEWRYGTIISLSLADDTLNKLEFSFGELLDDRPRKKLISVSFSLPLITLLSFTSCPSRLTPHSNSFYSFFLAGKFSLRFCQFFVDEALCQRAGSTHCMRSFIITARI